MELGNLLFGNSRGTYPVPRVPRFKAGIERLCEAVNAYRATVQGVAYDESITPDVPTFDTPVFALRPYYWGECTCSYGPAEYAWEDAHSHTAACAGMGACDCGYEAAWREFIAVHDHAPDCALVLPNFHYKPEDYRLSWYKYPLRDAYASHNLTPAQFETLVDACLASLRPKTP